MRHEVETLLACAAPDRSRDGPRADEDARTTGAFPQHKNIGRYSILRSLGSGGMAEVYLARDTQLLRQVALKRVTVSHRHTPDALARLLLEAQVLGQLDHPNIAAVHDVVVDGDDTYIVMEYVPGDTLAALIGRGQVPLDTVFKIMGQIADALVHAHARGIVHRDLKPANVIFRTDGLVKVLDFGIARLLSAAMTDTRPANSNLTRAGVIIGTPADMAPEQFLGSEVDERADLDSLGVLLFELVTGQRPHQQRDVIQIAEAKLTGPPPPVPAGVPEGLVSVITRALQGDPAARYQSAEEFGNALRGQSAVVSSPPGRWGVWRGWRDQAHRHTRRWTMAAVAVCALGAGVMVVGRIPRPPQSAQARVAKLPVVAVVPFATLTQGDVQVDSFAGGIPSLIASRLTTLKGMTVVPYSETLLSYRSQPSRASTIARELGADYVVTGEVQRVGPSIVVAVSLVDSASSQSTWSDNYTGDPEDAAGIQRRVIQRVTAAFVDRKLASPGEGAPAGDLLAGQSPTGRNQEALAEYGQGRRYLERPDDPDNLEYALRLFRSATAKEPRFALAYAAAGEALWLK